MSSASAQPSVTPQFAQLQVTSTSETASVNILNYNTITVRFSRLLNCIRYFKKVRMEVWDQNLAILIALTSYIAFTAVFCYCTSHD